MKPLIIIVIISILIFIICLTSKSFKRGRKPIYPRDDRIKLNLKARDIRIIKVTLRGGESGSPDVTYYEIWEKHCFLFSARWDARNYYTLEDAEREAKRLKQYTEIETKQEEISCQ